MTVVLNIAPGEITLFCGETHTIFCENRHAPGSPEETNTGRAEQKRMSSIPQTSDQMYRNAQKRNQTISLQKFHIPYCRSSYPYYVSGRLT